MRVLADPAVTQPGQENSVSSYLLNVLSRHALFNIDAMQVGGEKCTKGKNYRHHQTFCWGVFSSVAEKSATRNVMSLFLSLSHYQ